MYVYNNKYFIFRSSSQSKMAMSGKKFDMSQIKPEAFCGKVKQAKKLAGNST